VPSGRDMGRAFDAAKQGRDLANEFIIEKATAYNTDAETAEILRQATEARENIEHSKRPATGPEARTAGEEYAVDDDPHKALFQAGSQGFSGLVEQERRLNAAALRIKEKEMRRDYEYQTNVDSILRKDDHVTSKMREWREEKLYHGIKWAVGGIALVVLVGAAYYFVTNIKRDVAKPAGVQ